MGDCTPVCPVGCILARCANAANCAGFKLGILAIPPNPVLAALGGGMTGVGVGAEERGLGEGLIPANIAARSIPPDGGADVLCAFLDRQWSCVGGRGCLLTLHLELLEFLVELESPEVVILARRAVSLRCLNRCRSVMCRGDGVICVVGVEVYREEYSLS